MHRNEVVDLKTFRHQDMQQEAQNLPHLPAGTRLLLGQYTIEDYLNCGGFGITYIASDSLNRRVVIKECFPGEMCYRDGVSMAPRSPKYAGEVASMIRHFVIEAHNLANIRHPNIVHVHQVFEQNDTAYMAMDFVDGADLLDLVETGTSPLPPKHVQRITRTLLTAIAEIHAQCMLHRDISPDNILIDRKGEPVLIDFGAARSHVKQSHKVNAKMKFVKDGYSPQEFYVGGSAQGTFSDLYSFAASIYHVITGAAPVDSESRLKALNDRAPDPYVPLVGNVSGYPHRFLKALDTALAVLPQDRLQTAGEWLDRIRPRSANIRATVSRPATAVLESLSAFDEMPITNARPRRSLHLTGVAAAALLTLGGISVYALTGANQTVPTASLLADLSLTPAPASSEPTIIPKTLAVAPRVQDLPVLAALAPDATLPTVIASSPTLKETDLAAAPGTLPEATEKPQPPADSDVAVLIPSIDTPTRPETRPGLATPTAKRTTPVDPAPLPTVARPLLALEGPTFTSADRDTSGLNASPRTNTVNRGPRIAALPAPTTDPQIVTDTQPPVLAETSGLAQSRWDVQLPFVSRIEQQGDKTSEVVAFLFADTDTAFSGEWITEGAAIFAVDGQPLTPDKTLVDKIVAGLTIDPDGYARAIVQYRAPGSDMMDIGTLTLPVVRKTTLADGTVMTTGVETGKPVTRVTTLGTSNTGLKVGDIVVEETTTGTWVSTHQDIEDAFATLTAQNDAEAAFTVLRDGRRQTALWAIKNK